MRHRERQRQRERERDRETETEREKVSNLMFYAQSTFAVISGRKRDRLTGRQIDSAKRVQWT